MDNNSYLPSTSVPPNQTLQFDQSPFPSYYQIDNTLFEQSPVTMPPEMNISQNQPLRIGHSGESKTNAEIICENYLKQYSTVTDNVLDTNYVDPLLNDPLINQSGEAEFDLLNYDDSTPMAKFPEFDYLNSNDFEITNQNLFAPSPSSLQYTDHFLSSDVVNSSSNWPPAAESLPPPPPPPSPPNGAVAAINGEASSSMIKKKGWCKSEHHLFLVGMDIFGKGDWKRIAKKVIITKSYKQVASHAQKYFNRQQLPKEKRKRPSIHDINTVDPVLLMQVCVRLGLPLPQPPPQPPPLPTGPLINYSTHQTEQSQPIDQ